MRVRFLALSLLLLSACDRQDLAMPCEPVGVLEPICGLQAPEDIEVTPDGSSLLISQFGGMFGGTGNLALLDPDSGVARRLFPVDQASSAGESWGDSNCPGQPGEEFAPHGIHLSQRAGGEWQLLVVNHGDREAVEFFELTGNGGDYALQWRGCAVLPAPSFLNDVVGTPDGGFLVSHMYAKNSLLSPLKTMTGKAEGHAWHWSGDGQLRVFPGSEGAFPNGIQISPDGDTIYLNHYFGSVLVLDRHSGERLTEIPIHHADNIGWLPDGRLVFASHIQEGLIPELCMNVGEGACSQRFQIIAVNPETYAQEILLDHKGAPMGAGTIAQQLGGNLYIGSYAGGRLLRVPTEALPIVP